MATRAPSELTTIPTQFCLVDQTPGLLSVSKWYHDLLLILWPPPLKLKLRLESISCVTDSWNANILLFKEFLSCELRGWECAVSRLKEAGSVWK